MFKRYFQARFVKTGIAILAFLLILVYTQIYYVARKINQLKNFPLVHIIGPEITHGDKTKKQVIFTFDGGSSVGSTEQILNVLAIHHVKGTFFLTGKFVEANSKLVKRMIDEGHEVFSHTYDHPHLTAISDVAIGEQFADMEKVLDVATHISPKPYFRPPYGDRDARVLEVAKRAGYQSVYWTIDAKDWMESEGETAESVSERILANISPGTIYLMHLGDSITGSILDTIFTAIEARGYKAVSLTEGI